MVCFYWFCSDGLLCRFFGKKFVAYLGGPKQAETIMINKLLLIAFLWICALGSVVSAHGDEEYSFVKFDGRTPYIILDHTTSQELLKAIKENKALYIDETQVEEIHNIILRSDDNGPENLRAYIVQGNSTAVQNILSRQFVIQEIAISGGRQHEISVDKILYYPGEEDHPTLFVKCQPLDFEPAWPRSFPSFDYLPASSYRQRAQLIDSDDRIPTAVSEKTEMLSEVFFRSLADLGNANNQKRVSLSAIGGKDSGLYCALISYGGKGFYSTLYVLDEKGDVKHREENNEMVEILGTTDVNRDGEKEMILHYSSGDYSGGIGVMMLKKNKKSGKFNVVMKSKRATYHPQ